MNRDQSDLSSNTVKIDYQSLLTMAQEAVASAHLLVQDYERRTDTALNDLFHATYPEPMNPTDILHASIAADHDAQHLAEVAQRYARAVHLYHILWGAVNRSEVLVINTPYKDEESVYCANCDDLTPHGIMDKFGNTVCSQGCADERNSTGDGC